MFNLRYATVLALPQQRPYCRGQQHSRSFSFPTITRLRPSRAIIGGSSCLLSPCCHHSAKLTTSEMSNVTKRETEIRNTPAETSSSGSQGSQWARLQATYQEIVKRNTFENGELKVVENLDKIMKSTVDNAKVAVDNLTVEWMTALEAGMVKESVAKKVKACEESDRRLKDQVTTLLKEKYPKVNDWYQPGLVNVDNENDHLSFQSAYPAKQRALVISGESGSGKSLYALHLKDNAKMNGKDFDAALFLSLSDYSSSTCWEEEWPTRSAANKELYDYLTGHLIPFLQTDVTNDCSCVFDMLSILNENRNKWAISMLQRILLDQISKEMRYWIYGAYRAKLESLLVIIDEVGMATMFAHGLIDSVRTLQQDVFNDQARSVGLVLCGAGIEEVARSDLEKFGGTDPGKSVIIMMGQPNIEVFDKISGDAKPMYCDNWNTDIHNGISHCLKQKGTRAQIMGTNMRLLRVGVLPGLLSDLAYDSYVDSNDRTRTNLGQHLENYQDNKDLMMNGIGRYMRLNSMSRKTPEQQRALLNHVFMYCLRKSLQGIMSKRDNKGTKKQQQPDEYHSFIDGLIEQLPVVNYRTSVDDKTIVNMGLVTSDPSKTSSAMKYMACEGHLRDVLPGEGMPYEELVATHLERYYACKNWKGARYRLEEQVAAYEKGVDVAALMKVYKELLKMDADLIVIVQPQGDNAEGPDIMVLDRDSSQTAQLDLYHVKHVTDMSGFADDEVQRRLFSGPGCNKHAALLERGLRAKIRSRYLQLSSPFTSLSDEHGQLKHEYNVTGVHVLPREAVQPSWDAYSVGDLIWEDKTQRSEGMIGKSRG